MRATQHEELMREAGFESGYDRELEERRARRRRRLSGLLGLVVTVAVAAPLTILGIPRIGGLVALIWLPVPAIVVWVQARARDRLGWDEEGNRR